MRVKSAFDSFPEYILLSEVRDDYGMEKIVVRQADASDMKKKRKTYRYIINNNSVMKLVKLCED